jgi:hypothetical protein
MPHVARITPAWCDGLPIAVYHARLTVVTNVAVFERDGRACVRVEDVDTRR